MLRLPHTTKLDFKQCLIFHWGTKASEARERARKLPPRENLLERGNFRTRARDSLASPFLRKIRDSP